MQSWILSNNLTFGLTSGVKFKYHTCEEYMPTALYPTYDVNVNTSLKKEYLKYMHPISAQNKYSCFGADTIKEL